VNQEAAKHSATVRELTRQYLGGKREAFEAFRKLVQLLLALTVLADNQFVRVAKHGNDQSRRALGGARGPLSPVRLRDGRWLRVAYSLHLAPHNGSKRLKVEQTSVQYQVNETDQDEGGLKEIFRYDYLREDDSEHPNAHINIHGSLIESDALGPGVPLADVHFPTARVPLEAILRLLIVDFGIDPATPREVWRPVLATSETAFQEIAHQPLPPGADA
jgi:hypothetical protein